MGQVLTKDSIKHIKISKLKEANSVNFVRTLIHGIRHCSSAHASRFVPVEHSGLRCVCERNKWVKLHVC